MTAPVAVVTGANSGIGLPTAVGLASRGFEVVLACRNPGRAGPAAARVAGAATGPAPWVVELDLADLASVAAASDAVRTRVDAVRVLVANAGVMAVPWQPTADGFELQLGTNHLGHFALTGRLWPLLTAGDGQPASGGRVVTVSSVAAASGAVRFDDLQWDRAYDPWAAYSRSKLANLLFARELARRAGEDRGSSASAQRVASVAVHPGYSATRLWDNGPMPWSGRRARLGWRLGAAALAQSAVAGARPSLRAATEPGVRNGDYLAPRGPLHLRGRPTRIRYPRAATDDAVARQLWEVSEDLTGVRFLSGAP